MSGPQARIGSKEMRQQRVDALAKASQPTITQEDWEQIRVVTGGDSLQALELRIFCHTHLGELAYDRFFDGFVEHGDMSGIAQYEEAALRFLESVRMFVATNQHPVFAAAALYGAWRSGDEPRFMEPRANHNPGANY